MGIARSTYYDAPVSTLDDTAIVEAIGAICDEFEHYGWRRVRAALRHQGMVVNLVRDVQDGRRDFSLSDLFGATAPFIWPVHEAPRDFYRYSPFGLRHLLEATGFEVIEVVPLAGAWTTFSLELSYALRKYRRRGLTPLVNGVMRTAQWAGARWDRVDFQPRFSWSHLAVARAAASGAPPEDPSAARP